MLPDIIPFLRAHLRAGALPATLELAQLHDLIARLPPEITTDARRYRDALLSPIRRLPPELLSEIFLWCLPPARFVSPAGSDPPLVLGQVSHLWRVVALSTPRLWSSCEIMLLENPSDDLHESEERIVALLSLWLERSAAVPLSLSLRNNTIHSPIVMGLLNRYCHRWRHVAIEILPYIPPPLQLTKEKFPLQLESLELRRPDVFLFDAQDSPYLATFASSAAQLRRLVWDAEPFPSRNQWPNLSHLDIGSDMSMEACVMVIGNCPGLTELICRNVHQLDDIAACIPVTQGHLRSLTLHADTSFHPFFANLTLPALSCLNLTTTGGEDEDSIWPLDTFRDFVSRSCCRIESFNFYFPRMNDAMFLECARILQSSLTELTLQRSGSFNPLFTDDVVDQLIYNEEGDVPCLLPHLEVLALYNCTSCAPGRLITLVRSRLLECKYPKGDQRHVNRLRILEGFDTDRDMEELKEIAKQHDSGLTLQLYNRRTGALLSSLSGNTDTS